MRIAMLSPVVPMHSTGGVQDIVWSLSRGLVERGHEVSLITTGRADGAEGEARDGIEVHFLAGVPPMRPVGAWRRLSFERVRDLHAESPLDVVHSQSFCGVHLAGTLPGIPVVASPHGTHIDELRTRERLIRESLRHDPMTAAKTAGLWLLMLGRLRDEGPRLRRCDAVIATSHEQREVLLDHYHVPAERLYDVWNGIDTSLFDSGPADPAVRDWLGVAPEVPLVLAAARLYQEKGIQHALRAWPRVLARVPGAMLVIAGDGPYRATLESLTESLGIGAEVRFIGMMPLENLAALYRACDVFVNPTVRINGYDLTILQAMASGKPVVVSNVGSVPTAVSDGVNGVLAPPGKPAALAERLNAVLSDPLLCARLGAAAHQSVRRRFSLDTMVEGTLAVYRAAHELREVRA